MNPNIHDTLNTILSKIENMNRQLKEVRDQVDVNCRNLVTRIGRLETNQRRTTEEENSRNDRSPRRERVPPYYAVDADAQYIKSVKAVSYTHLTLPTIYSV